LAHAIVDVNDPDKRESRFAWGKACTFDEAVRMRARLRRGCMTRNEKGRIGCGCLIFVLVVIVVVSGVLAHPWSLRAVGGWLRSEDKIVPADAIFVPRFWEDREGEAYIEAFREYHEGNGKAIWIEDGPVLGSTVGDIVARMAKERRIKEDIVRKMELDGDTAAKARQAKGVFDRQGCRKVIIAVPDYASREFSLLYATHRFEGGTLFMIRPVKLRNVHLESWWKDDETRSMVMREFYGIARFCIDRFKGVQGSGENGRKPPGRDVPI
jgi:hypothetical protein